FYFSLGTCGKRHYHKSKSHHAAADTQMWGFSPVNKRSQRLANDGSRYIWPSRVSTQIDKNRVKRSARSGLVFRQSMGVLLSIGGQFPTFEGKTDSHGRSFTTCRDGILSWLDGWPVRWRAGAQAWLDA